MRKLICCVSVISGMAIANAEALNDKAMLYRQALVLPNDWSMGYMGPVSSIEEMEVQLKKRVDTLNIQLKYISQKLMAVQQFSAAQKALNVQWVGAKNGTSVPGAMQIENTTICHADFLNGKHPGILNTGGCLITYGGYSVIRQSYEVLVGNLVTQWKTLNSINPYQHPDQASNLWQAQSIPLQAGFENSVPLYLCKVNYNNATYIGKVVGEDCDFAVGSKEVISQQFQVLFVNKK